MLPYTEHEKQLTLEAIKQIVWAIKHPDIDLISLDMIEYLEKELELFRKQQVTDMLNILG